MKIGLVLKILIPIAIIAAIGSYVFVKSTPVAVVSETVRGLAVKAVPGTVNVLAEQEMFIKGEYGGRVIVSNLKAGGLVSKDDVLIELDTGDLDLTIAKAENDHLSAQKRIEIGSDTILELEARQEALKDIKYRHERGGATEVELNNALRSVKKAEDDIARSKLSDATLLINLGNSLKKLKRQKEKMSIISPIDGIVTDILAYEGDLLGGAATVAKVVSLTRIVEVKVSEEHFVGLKLGMPARVVLLGIEDERFDATIERIIPVADPLTQRFTVHLDVNIEKERLDPGLTGDATITLDEREDALQIPRAALVNKSVLVVKDGTVSRQPVQVGYTSITMVEILEGLSDGDQVIIEDLHLFENGERVRAVPKS